MRETEERPLLMHNNEAPCVLYLPCQASAGEKQHLGQVHQKSELFSVDSDDVGRPLGAAAPLACCCCFVVVVALGDMFLMSVVCVQRMDGRGRRMAIMRCREVGPSV